FVRLSTRTDDVWLHPCDDIARAGQQRGNEWVPLRDERPNPSNLQHAHPEAHCLDGTYQPAALQPFECDATACERVMKDGPLDGFVLNLPAREFVQTEDAPGCSTGDLDGGLQQVPKLVSIEPTGELSVRVRYFRDGECAQAVTEYLGVE
ncbi:MAG TPA: hypothetical protein VMF13_03655, partial [Luteitalea sp.]|nr:hypothetical protein [Luteitalea sp.]